MISSSNMKDSSGADDKMGGFMAFLFIFHAHTTIAKI
jgi:hypothetical protein